MVLELSTKEEPNEVPREDVFIIDGNHYTIPVKIPAVEQVRYLNDVRRMGTVGAVSALLHRVVSDNGMEKLAKVPNLPDEALPALIKRVNDKIDATVGEALGN
jgi:hypothetical protein